MRTSVEPAAVLQALRRVCHDLWSDESGSMSWVGTILATSIFTLGMLVGLSTLRDHVMQQYGDVATGLDQLDQSWRYEYDIDLNGDGDSNDPGECHFEGRFDDTSTLTDPAGGAPAGLTFVAP